MKKVIFLLFVFLLCIACTKEQESSTELTLMGIAVMAPDNTPIKNAIVSVTDGSTIVGRTTTGEDGSFSLVVDKEYIDVAYYLSITEPSLNMVKKYDILGYGQSFYDYGYIVLYDSRNPYNLQTFMYDSYTYIVHPLLREEYGMQQAISVCERLVDYDISDWFLPNYNELYSFFMSLTTNELKEYPNGAYCLSSNTATVLTKIYKENSNSWEFNTSTNIDGNGTISKVLPMARYR